MFLALGKHPPANAFLSKKQLKFSEAKFPLRIFVCLDCALIQVKDYIPKNFFVRYFYLPSASNQMIKHFEQLAKILTKKFQLSKKSLVVDVGSNDGTFLSNFTKTKIKAFGIDPSVNMAKLAKTKGVKTVTEYFNSPLASKVSKKYGKANVILTTNTFNHIDNLHEFMAGVTIFLEDEGVFVIEVPHALELVKNVEFDTVYHEHLSQFSVKSIMALFETFNMEIFDIEGLPIHGGSMRIYGRKKKGKSSVSKVVSQWVNEEKNAKLFQKSTYDNFSRKVKENKKQLWEILSALKRSGKRLVGYGAPAKGNTLLNYYKIGPDTLEYLVDRNPLKHGFYSPGMHIPILPAETLVKDMPDFTLILAWNFAEEIVRQQQRYIKRGGKFIIPIPKPIILK
jgi:SAM-dependent methyltransferase